MIDLQLLSPDRSQLKQDIIDLQTNLEAFAEDIELDKARLHLSYVFVTKASDLKGRNLEFKLACSLDPVITPKETKLKSIQSELRNKERLLSEINYDQRDRTIASMATVAGATREFVESVKGFTNIVTEFNKYVEKLVNSRKQ